MAKGKKAANKKSSVLAGQRPKRSARKKPKNYRAIFKFLAVATTSVPLIYGGHYLYSHSSNLIPSLWPDHSSREWAVRFSAKTDAKLKPEAKDYIISFLKKHVGSGDYEELLPLVKDLQAHYAADRVGVIRVGQNDLLVTVVLRKAVMRIKADRERLVTAEGVVYGLADESDKAKLPLITGVFNDEQRVLEWNEDASLVIGDEQKSLLAEAMVLIKSAREKNIQFGSIDYIKYRGFIPAIKDSQIEVALGRAPFTERIGKLNKILLKLKKKGVSASRIELDYNDKAFVKEATL